MKITGIELITNERKEQIEKHGRDINSDVIGNPNGEISMKQAYCCSK